MKNFLFFLLIVSSALMPSYSRAQDNSLDIGIFDASLPSPATQKFIDVRLRPDKNISANYTAGIFTLRLLKNTATLSIVSSPQGYSMLPTTSTLLYDYYTFNYIGNPTIPNPVTWPGGIEVNILKLEVNISSGVGTTIELLNDSWTNSNNGSYYQELNSSADPGAQKGIYSSAVLFSGALLPVTLTSFTAEKKGESSLIKWSTVSEKDLSGYFVERSADGVIFHAIDYVQAKAKSESEKVSYEVIDSKPEMGINYYRLQTKEKKPTYSRVVSVDFGDGLKSKAYPNPFTSDLNVEIDIQENVTGEVLVDLIDVSGKQVFTKKVKMEGRKLAFNLPTENLVAGSYIIRIESGGRKWQHKITKQ